MTVRRGWRRVVFVAILAACSAGHGTSGGESTSAVSGAVEQTSAAEATGGSTGGPDEPWPPYYPAPDCDELSLPGNPDDVALTPRSDRDAEILALRIAPELFVGPQDRYDVIAADLGAIRRLEPALADVHIDCEVPVGYDFWFFGDGVEVVDAVWLGTYRAWDCHNAFYGVTDIRRTDGRAFRITVDGVFSDLFPALYRGIPGLENAMVGSCWSDLGYPCGRECTPEAGSIALEPTFEPDGTLADRLYTFEHPTDGTFVYAVAPGQPPERID